MVFPAVDKLARKLLGMRILKRLWNRISFPGVRIADEANADVRGAFAYGGNCTIGSGANLIVPAGASLELGEGCHVGRYVELNPGKKVVIGSYTTIQDRSIFVGDVTIGRYCLISLNVLISSGRHYFELQPHMLIRDQDRLVAQDEAMATAHSRPVIVEDDCWLGVNAVIMAGVTIGKGAVVGANSVVTRNVPPYSVVAGVPAREIKKRMNFEPPERIDFANPCDWPYFYSGFEVSQAAQDRYSVHGGMAALDEFELCLDSAAGSAIHVLIKNVGPHKSGLIFENQRRALSGEFQEVVFELGSQRGKKTRLRMRPDDAGAIMIIQRAWIQ